MRQTPQTRNSESSPHALRTQRAGALSMPDEWPAILDASIEDRFGDIVAIRRHLHAHPELSGQERETSLYLYQQLGDQQFAVQIGPDGRGVIADYRVDDDPQTTCLALRADIDALPIHDTKSVAYRSRTEGVMHACGHDEHTATVFGALLALKELAQSGHLPVRMNFRGIFQPAEETCEGAIAMVQHGVLDGVDAILAVHVDPTRPAGVIGVRPGVLTANCDEMRITIRGRGGHAARPHETSDPIAAAAQLINALYLHIPRATDSQDAVVVTIGQVKAGSNANVIPESVLLRGTIRTLDRAVRRQTMEHVCRLAHGMGQTTDTQIDVQFGLSSDSVENDGRLIQLFREAGAQVLGDDGVVEIPKASMGSEDFAFYLKQVPGAMIRLGCASDRVGGMPLHTPTFDLDERSLAMGARILSRVAVLRALEKAAG